MPLPAVLPEPLAVGHRQVVEVEVAATEGAASRVMMEYPTMDLSGKGARFGAVVHAPPQSGVEVVAVRVASVAAVG